MAERHTVDVDVVGSKPIRLPRSGQIVVCPDVFKLHELLVLGQLDFSASSAFNFSAARKYLI